MEREEALFAAGCFWGVEETSRKTPGVLETEVGYSGGHTENPSYEDVCGGGTGHAETVRVVFDPEQISYEKLIHAFFDLHDPTQVNRQGPDVGDQYRSAIFYNNDEQKIVAEKIKNELNQEKYENRIATEIIEAGPFYRGEDYHQQYFLKRGTTHG